MDNRIGWLSLLGLGLVVIVWAAMSHLSANAGDQNRAGGTDASPGTAEPEMGSAGEEGAWRAFVKPSEDELEKRLDPLSYRVTQEEGTEPPFRNRYWDNHEAGLYVDIVSGEPLFSSKDKFDSGTGWPSFTQPVVRELVQEHRDASLGMVRTEVRSKLADSHLGHIFDDGPEPTGLRYCINSAALRFIPVDQLERQGYGEFLGLFGQEASMSTSDRGSAAGSGGASMGSAAASMGSAPASGAAPASAGSGVSPSGASSTVTETVILAGGCFWGMEDILREIPGVIDTEVGYTGGTVPNATYEIVKKGTSGHAESVRIVFDPAKLSFEDLLGYYFRMHDPTTKNRQGNDVGSQYRSAIFYFSEAQRETAERVKKAVDASGKWSRPIVTEIVPAGEFYSAEAYHQDYLEKNPNGYTCHYLRD